MKIFAKKKIVALLLGLVAALSFCMFAFTANTAKAEVKPATGKVEIYQLAPNSIELSHSYVIKTSNNKIIVMDGGLDNASNTYGGESYLPKAIRAILGLGENEHFTVDAWFLSHPHNDHIAELARMLYGYEDGDSAVALPDTISGDMTVKADDNYTIKNFYFDFPEDSELKDVNARNNISKAWVNLLKEGMNKYALANNLGENYYDQVNGAVVNAKTIKDGLNIEIDGVRFEVLQTWSEWDGNANDMSMVVRVWADGQSVMFLGDVDNAASNRLLYNYGADFLKADVVQLAHHGQNGAEEVDPATGNVVSPLYDAIQAKVRLWPTHNEIWQVDKNAYEIEHTTWTSKTAFVGSGTPTAWVREMFGLPADHTQMTASTATDLVACLSIHPENNGYTVASWTDEVLNSMKIEIPTATAFKTENNFVMQDGASMRVNDAETTGIRFVATMDSYDTEATYGMIIVPRDYLDGVETTDYVKYFADNEISIVNLTCNVFKKGGQYAIQGSITNIQYGNMDRQFVGIGYEEKDGVYTYAAFDSLDDISRSAFNVATKAANADAINDTFDDDQDGWIQGYINKALALKSGVAENDYNAETKYQATLSLALESADIDVLEPTAFTLNSSFDADTIEYVYNTDELFVDAVNKTVTALKFGDFTLTAKAGGESYTATLNVSSSELKDDYLATFDSPLYKNYISRDNDVNTGGIGVEWLEEYAGETGVMKITMTNDNSGSKNSAWVLDLFKDYTGGYTVKYRLEDLFVGNGDLFAIRWHKANAAGTISTELTVTYPAANIKYNEWVTKYVADSNADNCNKIAFSTETGDGVIMYISWIRDGDAITRDAEAAKAAAIEEMRADLADKDGVLATFDHKGYEYFVSKVQTSSFTTEYIPSYTDGNGITRTGVLKVTMNLLSGGGQWECLKLELLKQHSGSYTLEYLIDSSYVSPGQVAFYKSSGNTQLDIFPSPTRNVWLTQTVPMNEATNAIYFGVVNESTNTTITLYLSLLLDGSASPEAYYAQAALKADLDTNELASFDIKEYETLVHALDTDDTITATYLPEFKGEKGVLKVEIDNSKDVANSGLYLDLVNSINATNGYTVRMYMECNTAPTAMYIKGSNSYGTAGGDELNAKNIQKAEYWNNWQSHYITTVGSELNSFYILTYTANSASTSYTFYFSVIMDGDQRDAIMTANRTAAAQDITEENVLATFDSEAYLALLDISSTSGRVAPYTAEIVDDPLATESARKVLKLTITLSASSAWDFVTIHLPKAYTNSVTVEYYIPETDSTSGQLAFIPADDSFSSYHFTETKGAWTKKQAKWSDKSGTNIEIGKVNTNKDGTILTIYISCIWNGTVA